MRIWPDVSCSDPLVSLVKFNISTASVRSATVKPLGLQKLACWVAIKTGTIREHTSSEFYLCNLAV
jgi:hypothetical protein